MAGASSSSSGGRWKYDVFINFRGEDTRRGFVCHLYEALKQKALDTFIDSEELRKGDDLSELLKAIQDSRLSIVVFSQNYASSTWCLKELVQILECMDTQKQIVVPIFYEVEPSDVRKRRGSFAEAFATYASDSNVDMEELESWKCSLIRATNVSGWDSKNYQDDIKLIKDIVEDILKRLIHISRFSPSEPDGLVGMDSHIYEIDWRLQLGVDDFRIVGIWGMGGIGKSTIAKAVYKKIAHQFQHSCFLDNVKKEFLTKNGGAKVTEELLSKILKVNDRHILDEGLNMIRERLGTKKVLLVLDDVDNLDQIETLIGKKPSFGGGSRIIITTRDKHLLAGYAIYDAIYEPKSFTDDKALELFSQYAFRTNPPSRNYNDLSRRAIQYARGLPLALKVLGAFLYNKSVHEWEDELEKLKKIPNRGIQGVLRTSFDGLDDAQKNIFLDIACFFRGYDEEYVTKLLDSFGFFPRTGLRVLVDRALITISRGFLIKKKKTISRGWLEMHDLIQEMGRDIVNGDPRGPSRLWRYEDVHRVLSQNTDTGAVEGIVLNLSKLKEVYINTEAFESMKKLRLLQLHDDDSDVCEQHVSGDLKFLSSELKYLKWYGCPLKSLPSNFDPKNLVDLDLRNSQYLIKTPDLTVATNLEILNLQHCVNLVEVHPSIPALKNLVHLNLQGCKELKIFPSFTDLKSLQKLNLSGCSNLEKFPEISEHMELKKLSLDETAITELPSSIEFLQELVILTMRNCRSLVCLPDNICKLACLEKLYLDGCSNLEKFPEISEDMKLKKLSLDETAITELPSSIEFLQELVILTMTNCRSLVCLPDNICKLACLKELYLDGCSKLSNLPENLGDLKQLSCLRVEKSGIQQLPFSILSLSKLEKQSLSCRGCKEMTAPFSSWPTWMQKYPRDCVLVNLDLSDCNLFELSNGIAQLSSLNSLKLCRNNKLESLPTAMNRLVRLTELHLEGCKRLKSIPELSSCIRFINAQDCTALKTVSTPKYPYVEQSFNSFIFYNCFQLETNLFTDIVETVTDNQGIHDPTDVFVCLPAGCGIPDWFDRRCSGSSVTVKLPPNWFPNKFLGLAICAISNLRRADNKATLESALCWCTFKANDGDEKSFHFPLVGFKGGTNNLLESDHMLMSYEHSSSLGEWHNQGKYTEARFRIVTSENGDIPNVSMTSLEDCSWITRCGVRLFHVNNEDSLSVDLRNSERSKRKRETLERERDDGSEEGEGCSGGPICCCLSLTGCTIALRKRQREGEGDGVTGATGSETQEEDVALETTSTRREREALAPRRRRRMTLGQRLRSIHALVMLSFLGLVFMALLFLIYTVILGA